MIARALMLQGRWSDAESELRRVLTMAPRGSEFYTTALGFLADTLFSQQRFADAIPVYREFVSLRPHDAGAFINFGVSLAQSGQIADGAAAFHRALQIDPGNAVARRNAAIADEELKSRK
jgi:Flp pilus assembly protein TadD